MPLSYLKSYNITMMHEANCPLLDNLSKVHTTPMGADRIRKNLSLDDNVSDVVNFCKQKISSPDCHPVVECPRSGCIETTSTKRPPFDEIKSFAEFSRYYWYREELQAISKSLKIDASGMKAELNHNIEQYFQGNLIRQKKAARRTTSPRTTSKSPITLTPQTSLIECGFCFNQRFRDFFSQQTGITNFKFNVDMVATARKVKETNDITFTLGDLLDVFYGTKTYAKYDKVSLQWNRFVQDFCADPATSNFPNKLKTASILWKEVRTSTREKIYTTELLKEFSDIINKEN